MPILSKCCCCSLQAGVITLGVLGLIIPTILSGVMIWVLTWLGMSQYGLDQIHADYEKTKQMVAGLGDLGDDFNKNDDNYNKAKANADSFMGLGWGMCIGVTVFLIFLILMNILLIVGAAKDKAKLLLPWMGYTLLSILANIIGMIVMFAGSDGFQVSMLVQVIVYAGVSILIWLCVFSLYQEINERRQNQTYQQPMQKM